MTSPSAGDALPQLVAAHPALFRGKNPGTFLPPGWYGILDRLCSEIEQVLGDDVAAIEIHQIKPKFASLRFYYALDVPEPPGEPLEAKVTRHAGGFKVAAQSRHSKRRAVDEAIAIAGLASEQSCEECGKSGEQFVNGAYVYVACPRHRRTMSITSEEWLARKRRGDP